MDDRHQFNKPDVFHFRNAFDLIGQQLRVCLDCDGTRAMQCVNQLSKYQSHVLCVIISSFAKMNPHAK